ncbi:MAG: OB-fold nucleic acid binding domain-containing protein, partial [Syntrophomonas sp.]|nr:OB-fold nucleic acid binding domain-containing protein [Syntrophomonas sp.]
MAGIVVNLSRRVSRKGESYARFFLEDLGGRIEVLVFPSAYRKNGDRLEADRVVIVEGYFDRREEQPKIALRKTGPIPERVREMHLRLAGDDHGEMDRNKLLSLLHKYPGDIEVFLHLPGRRMLVLNEALNVSPSRDLKDKLAAVYGSQNVW